MKKITAELLRQKHACTDMVERFELIFPSGTYCNKRDVKRWMDDNWGLWQAWAVYHLLNAENQNKFWSSADWLLRCNTMKRAELFAKLWRSQK